MVRHLLTTHLFDTVLWVQMWLSENKNAPKATAASHIINTTVKTRACHCFNPFYIDECQKNDVAETSASNSNTRINKDA